MSEVKVIDEGKIKKFMPHIFEAVPSVRSKISKWIEQRTLSVEEGEQLYKDWIAYRNAKLKDLEQKI